ncbi:MAG: polysaccharide pyruvyl transferase family protein [Ilumatobacteraceae bacterium]|nr:polysaccharide pyruvyl transferase family protein [Ilumatobacteraceae bacterium]
MRRSIDADLDEVIGRPKSVALLMFPFDGNVGNHMMWLAITRYLAERDVRVGYSAHAGNLDIPAMRRAIGDDPVLFLGGVTMSSLWPDHREAKRRVAAECPQNRIVQLTSTTLFIDDDDREAARHVFDGHPDVSILARDPSSAEQLESLYDGEVQVRLSHDSAFRLGARESKIGESGIGWLARNDAERLAADGPSIETFDWPEIYEPIHRTTYLALRTTGLLSRLRGSRSVGGRLGRLVNASISRGYGWASSRLVDYGVDVLSTRHVLVTDRMHPHVLAVMIGQQVVLLPDKFGKNRAVFDYSTQRFPNVHWADDADTAREIADTLMGTDAT